MSSPAFTDVGRNTEKSTIIVEEDKRRILTAANDIFHCLARGNVTGVLVGGAAALIHGQQRITKDLDINVESFPPFNDDDLPAGHSIRVYNQSDDMRKLKHTSPSLHMQSKITCDLSTRKVNADSDFDLYKNYSVLTEGAVRIRYAGLYLLLADKIATVVRRTIISKVQTDCHDITFCLEEIARSEENPKMPQELKKLYTQQDWENACGHLATYCEDHADDPGAYVDLVFIARTICVPHTPP
ncbi:hypothetical protein D9613_008095 [Agrocybe pediades]|uniref:Uncharacterized protein n=1 Tax=Agrocybe pediades TaxID=84607 RepID=A0A8H4QMS6_9AGAR|nr:hypothetical protein D9613_008095 [Agrocybe pediades]